jgi:hypothetical protein
MRFVALLLLAIWGSAARAQVGDCSGTPKEAVTKLPAPLGDWGQVLCTPYGHIITNLEGWIWTQPGGYSPVMIPSQMVRNNPEPLGNKSYFTEITFTRVRGNEFTDTYKVFNEGFADDAQTTTGYRLDAKSVSGKSLKLYFFETGDSIWGIWCSKECDPTSRFMLLNMKKPHQ